MNVAQDTDRTLRFATLAFVAAFIIHNADHARRGVDASPEPVVWAGIAVAMLTAALVTLVATRHGAGPRAAAIVGAAIAIGVAVTHLTPSASPLTDPLTVSGISPLSWIAVLGEIITAMALSIAGLKADRKNLA